jgi:hypothetical protein
MREARRITGKVADGLLCLTFFLSTTEKRRNMEYIMNF